MLSIVFPGQGSQFVGMGKEILESYPEVKIFYDEVDDALNQKLSNIIFNGPEEELILTENAQPAIMVVGIAIIKILTKRGFEINCKALKQIMAIKNNEETTHSKLQTANNVWVHLE